MGHESLIQRRPSLSHPGWLKYFFSDIQSVNLNYHTPSHVRTGSVIQKKASSEIEGKDGASEKTKSPRMNSWDRFVFVKTFSRISPQVENISSSKRENCRRGGYYAVRLGYCDIEI